MAFTLPVVGQGALTELCSLTKWHPAFTLVAAHWISGPPDAVLQYRITCSDKLASKPICWCSDHDAAHWIYPWEKNWPWLLTVSSPWPKWSQPAVTEPWPGPWLSCDLAVIILKMPWLSCDLAVTELWPSRDLAVTSPSRDWAVIIGPGAVTTVVTVSSRRQFFSHG